jgi:hypothetical protein
VNGAKRDYPHDEEIERALREIESVFSFHHASHFYISLQRVEGQGIKTKHPVEDRNSVVAYRPNHVSRLIPLDLILRDYVLVEPLLRGPKTISVMPAGGTHVPPDGYDNERLCDDGSR